MKRRVLDDNVRLGEARLYENECADAGQYSGRRECSTRWQSSGLDRSEPSTALEILVLIICRHVASNCWHKTLKCPRQLQTSRRTGPGVLASNKACLGRLAMQLSPFHSSNTTPSTGSSRASFSALPTKGYKSHSGRQHLHSLRHCLPKGY